MSSLCPPIIGSLLQTSSSLPPFSCNGHPEKNLTLPLKWKELKDAGVGSWLKGLITVRSPPHQQKMPSKHPDVKAKWAFPLPRISLHPTIQHFSERQLVGKQQPAKCNPNNKFCIIWLCIYELPAPHIHGQHHKWNGAFNDFQHMLLFYQHERWVIRQLSLTLLFIKLGM